MSQTQRVGSSLMLNPTKLNVATTATVITFAIGIILSGCYLEGILSESYIYACATLSAASIVSFIALSRLRDLAIMNMQKKNHTASQQVTEGTIIQVTPGAGFWEGSELSSATKMYRNTGNMDKFFKALNWAPRFVAQVLEADGASLQVVEGLRHVASDFVQIRNGVGLWNGFQSFPRLIYVWHDLEATAGGYKLLKRDPTTGALKKIKVNMSAPEKAMAVASKAFKLLEWISFNICFIVCAPAQWLNRWFKFGTHAQEVGAKFGLFFLIKDIFLTAAAYADLGHRKFELEREFPLDKEFIEVLKKTNRTEAERTRVNNYISKENDYRKAKFDTSITTVKSAADISLGFMGVLRVKTDPWVSLSLGLVSSTVGLYEIWRDTPSGGRDKRAMPARFQLTPAQAQKVAQKMAAPAA